MSELAACRMCLVADARMYTIANTPLQDVYERITDIPLQNGDTWPKKVCYICHHLLRKNQAFMEKSVKADELLRLVLDRGVELTEAYTRLTDTSKLCSSLGVSSPVFHNLGLQKQEEPVKEQPKREIEPSEDPLTGVRVKSEPLDSPDEMEIEIEGTELSGVCPENVGKGWTSPKQWTRTDALKAENESTVTEIICNLKVEIESNTNTVQIDTTPKRDNHSFNSQRKAFDSQKRTRKNIICPECGIDFKSRRTLNNHTKAMHPVSLECEHCKKVCKNKRTYARHINTHLKAHEKKIYPCNICHKELAAQKTLNQHMLIHTGERPHRCSQCNKAYTKKTHLKHHMLMHTGEKPHQCSLCEKAFTMKNHLRIHMLIHTGEKPHRCSLCNREFAQKTNLDRHMLTHTGEKLHSCSYCDKAFSTKVHLIEHTSTHTGIKPHRCTHCNKAFGQKSNLNKHLLMHGAKQFICDRCSKAFSKKNNLIKHMFVHTEEKPHRCSQCKKGFGLKSNLNTHMLVHTKEKRHKCTYCDKCFSLKNNLNKHISKMHTGKQKLELCE